MLAASRASITFCVSCVEIESSSAINAVVIGVPCLAAVVKIDMILSLSNLIRSGSLSLYFIFHLSKQYIVSQSESEFQRYVPSKARPVGELLGAVND